MIIIFFSHYPFIVLRFTRLVSVCVCFMWLLRISTMLLLMTLLLLLFVDFDLFPVQLECVLSLSNKVSKAIPSSIGHHNSIRLCVLVPSSFHLYSLFSLSAHSDVLCAVCVYTPSNRHNQCTRNSLKGLITTTTTTKNNPTAIQHFYFQLQYTSG